jgi:ABC-2 type transport system permease protein
MSVTAPPTAGPAVQQFASTSVPDTPRGLSLSALWALYTFTLRQHRHGRRWIVMAVLMLLPAGLAILVRSTARDVPAIGLEFIFAFMFIPQALMPLASLIYASGIIQDEQEDQTITYLLIRPLPKWAIYVVKLLATLTVTVLLTVLLTAVTYAAIYVANEQATSAALVRFAKAAAIHSLAVVAYCCIFGLISLLTKRILVAGILYIAIVEGLFANLAFGIRLITVIYYARLIAYRVMPFVVPTPMGTSDFAAEAWQLDVQNDPKLLEHPQLGTCIMVLVATSVASTLLAAWLCSRREFHVKTPEKAAD